MAFIIFAMNQKCSSQHASCGCCMINTRKLKLVSLGRWAFTKIFWLDHRCYMHWQLHNSSDCGQPFRSWRHASHITYRPEVSSFCEVVGNKYMGNMKCGWHNKPEDKSCFVLCTFEPITSKMPGKGLFCNSKNNVPSTVEGKHVNSCNYKSFW